MQFAACHDLILLHCNVNVFTRIEVQPITLTVIITNILHDNDVFN